MARRRIAEARMLITGASQGIGRALAEESARRGARVLAVARSESLLAELAEKVRGPLPPSPSPPRGAGGHGCGTIETLAADITSPQDRQRMVEAARERFGGLDILVNNAGIGATGHFAEV